MSDLSSPINKPEIKEITISENEYEILKNEFKEIFWISQTEVEVCKAYEKLIRHDAFNIDDLYKDGQIELTRLPDDTALEFDTQSPPQVLIVMKAPTSFFFYNEFVYFEDFYRIIEKTKFSRSKVAIMYFYPWTVKPNVKISGSLNDLFMSLFCRRLKVARPKAILLIGREMETLFLKDRISRPDIGVVTELSKIVVRRSDYEGIKFSTDPQADRYVIKAAPHYFDFHPELKSKKIERVAEIMNEFHLYFNPNSIEGNLYLDEETGKEKRDPSAQMMKNMKKQFEINKKYGEWGGTGFMKPESAIQKNHPQKIKNRKVREKKKIQDDAYKTAPKATMLNFLNKPK